MNRIGQWGLHYKFYDDNSNLWSRRNYSFSLCLVFKKGYVKMQFNWTHLILEKYTLKWKRVIDQIEELPKFVRHEIIRNLLQVFLNYDRKMLFSFLLLVLLLPPKHYIILRLIKDLFEKQNNCASILKQKWSDIHEICYRQDHDESADM